MNKDKELLNQKKIDFVVIDESTNKFNNPFEQLNKTSINLFN